jgi:predicted nuclease with TOPRIM domain
MQFVEAEKSKLEGELNYLIVEYDSLKMQSDSLAGQLEAEQEKIRRLLKREASSTTKIKMYQRELETLRKVMRSYIVQIDSLNTRNLELTEENIQVRKELREISTDYEELSKEKEELSSTVKVAQKLSAKNVVSEGLNRNSKPKDKISKIEKLRICFTVRENAVADAGSKVIYLTITRPDDIILSSPDAGMFMLDGESKVYSAKRELEYDNTDIDMCIYWDITEELIPGTYFINLYCEGFEIGTSTLILR